MTDVIYTVTVMTKDFRSQRTWGWFPTPDEAIEAVLTDEYDIFEYYYTYAVVEEFPAGISPYKEDQKTWWFQVDWEKSERTLGRLEIHPCEKPSEKECVIHFAMG